MRTATSGQNGSRQIARRTRRHPRFLLETTKGQVFDHGCNVATTLRDRADMASEALHSAWQGETAIESYEHALPALCLTFFSKTQKLQERRFSVLERSCSAVVVKQAHHFACRRSIAASILTAVEVQLLLCRCIDSISREDSAYERSHIQVLVPGTVSIANRAR